MTSDGSSASQQQTENETGRTDVSESPIQPAWMGLAQFHSNETMAMLQRYDQIVNLIRPGHHALSEGTFCEDLVRSFLRDTLPARFSVDTGFVIGSEFAIPWRSAGSSAYESKTTSASPQLDVIVHDTDNFAPVLRSGEFVVVLPDAVRAVIEVKKNLTSSQLQSSLQNLAATKRLIYEWTRSTTNLPFTSVFTFGAHEDLVPNGSSISATYSGRYNEICGPYPPSYGVPDLLLVARHVFFGRIQQDDYFHPMKVSWGPTVHNGINISGQLLLWHLMKRLRLPETNARIKRFQWPEDFPFSGELSFENPAVAREPLQG